MMVRRSIFAVVFLTFFGCSHSGTREPSRDMASMANPPDFVRGRGLCAPVQERPDRKLIIHHIDVGMGDSTFIRTPDGVTILIDGGLPGQGRDTILPLLRNCYRVDALDYVVLTHFDQDHMGGLTDVIASMPIRRAIYDPGEAMSTKGDGPMSPYTKFRAMTLLQMGKRRVPMPGANNFPETQVRIEVIAINGRLANGVQLPILTPQGTPRDDNAISMAIKITYGDFNYFIGGDLTGGGQRKPDVETAVGRLVGDVDVMHVNHHGSGTSSNVDFIRSLQAETAVISVAEGGMNARYLLPHDEVLDRYDDAPFVERVFLTSRGEGRIKRGLVKPKEIVLSGDILILAEPNRYQVNGLYFRTDGR